MIEKKKAKNREVHLAFIDLRKSYDTVPRQGMFKALSQLEIPKDLTEAVKNLYKNNNVLIKVGNNIVCRFKTSKRLLQGCPTSPTLFKIFLEYALTMWTVSYTRLDVYKRQIEEWVTLLKS